ncbi:MAG: NAD(P)H-dependent oxidoreductase subunit E [Planctomycetota bacterium]|nr:NAD(P)H-dependent oxidoreductase subunit E [Planctomycetota bacterium]
MSEAPSVIKQACAAVASDPSRLIDVLRTVQAQCCCVDDDAIDLIAQALSIPRIEVDGAVTFYAFLSKQPKGRIPIRLSGDIIDKLQGAADVAEAISQELGVKPGETTADGEFSLEWTACIGMCDQAPAGLIGDVVVTNLTAKNAREMIRELNKHKDPKKLVKQPGDGKNAHGLVRAMVRNNIRRPGPIIFSPINRGEAIRKALGMTPVEVIRAVKTARLRGRGGAGFPCGMKWEFTRQSPGERKFVICNADEGEPGTFKDRVLLTELPDRIFAGMTVAGYAIGAREGLVYLRAEYAYLKEYLEAVLRKRREDGWLGQDIYGKEGFAFDIRIQLGAGAYICGEETALISSAEGLRGDPKNRPPFPAQKGYRGCPTVVNNCETLCCVAKILEEGSATFSEHGTEQSAGTKLLSISGDCARPGIYDIEFGTPLRDVLEMAGAEKTQAVQAGGPSGEMIGPDQFDRTICFDDLATGGALMIFDESRDILEIVHAFMDFFVDESCGYCTPCRVGNVLLKNGIERLMNGLGEPGDLVQFEQMGQMMKACSRCGLGQTSWRPVVTSLQSFPHVYKSLVKEDADGFRRSFDLKAAVTLSEQITKRSSVNA